MSIDWEKAVKQVSPYVVRIEEYSESGDCINFGTGFKISGNSPGIDFIVTAAHVVSDDILRNNASLRLIDPSISEGLILPPDNQYWRIHRFEPFDIAIIMITSENGFNYPGNGLELLPADSEINIGRDVGWMGFPQFSPDVLCFFSGRISAKPRSRNTYLVDGNVFKGVSGGPTFHFNKTGNVEIIGIVSSHWYYEFEKPKEDQKKQEDQIKQKVCVLGSGEIKYIYGAHRILQNIKTLEDFYKKRKDIEDQLIGPTSIQSSIKVGTPLVGRVSST